MKNILFTKVRLKFIVSSLRQVIVVCNSKATQAMLGVP